jgi:hypothetical protein
LRHFKQQDLVDCAQGHHVAAVTRTIYHRS